MKECGCRNDQVCVNCVCPKCLTMNLETWKCDCAHVVLSGKEEK